MPNQDNDFKWFQDNMKSLYSKYPDKFLVISNQSIIAIGETFNEALEQALKTKKAGEFIIQQCEKENTISHYYNMAVSFA